MLQNGNNKQRLYWGLKGLPDLEHDDLRARWEATLLLEVILVELRLPSLIVPLVVVVKQLWKEKVGIVVLAKNWVVMPTIQHTWGGLKCVGRLIILGTELLRDAVD